MREVTEDEKDDAMWALNALVGALDDGGPSVEMMSPAQQTEAIRGVVPGGPYGIVETLIAMMEDEESKEVFANDAYSYVLKLLFSRLFQADPVSYDLEVERLIDHPVAGPIFLDAMSEICNFGRVPAEFMPALEKALAHVSPDEEWPDTLWIALEWQESPRALEIFRARRAKLSPEEIDANLDYAISKHEAWLGEQSERVDRIHER